jgi:hypothetical protein
MDDELDFTMSLPLPTLPEEVPADVAARIEAAIQALQRQLEAEANERG